MKIYMKRTYARHAMIGIWVIVFTVLIVMLSGYEEYSGYVAIVAFLVFFSVRSRETWQINKTVNGLAQSRERLASQQGFQYSAFEWSNISSVRNIAPMHIEDSRDEHFWNYIDAKQWQYCDFSYNYYRKMKHGEYCAGTVYYGVMFAKLPRKLPNVFFDSKKARGRQFRFTFKRNQRHSLEGNFDEYFATYFPDDYTIDSMSFISPDVMHALIDAAEYDIEIVGDIVCLYGPIYTNENDLLLMSQKLVVIKSQLMENILTYRDERLLLGVGRQTVAIQGMALNKSQFLKRLSFALVVLYVILRIVLSFVS